MFVPKPFGLGEFFRKLLPVRTYSKVVLGMRGKRFGKEFRTLRSGGEMLRKHFRREGVFQVHAVDLSDSGSRIEHGLEGVQKDADGRDEGMDPQEYPFDRTGIRTVGRVVGFLRSVLNERNQVSREVRLIVAPFVDEGFQNGKPGTFFRRNQSGVHAAERLGVRTRTVGAFVGSKRNDFSKEPIHFGMESGTRNAQDFERVGICRNPGFRIRRTPAASYAVLAVIGMGVVDSVGIPILGGKHGADARNGKPSEIESSGIEESFRGLR